jgi:hypothetical protein
MSGRGRPRITYKEAQQRALRVLYLMQEEEAAIRRQGRKPLQKQALARAATRLDMSERSARRVLSPAEGLVYVSPVDDWSKIALGAFLRQLRDDGVVI